MQTYKFRFISSHFVVTLSEKEITNNLLLKLIAINFNHNTLKFFFHIKISVNKISYSNINILIKKVKTFLCVEILKKR